MSRTIRTERHWFENTRRWDAVAAAEGDRTLSGHKPLTADGRFSDTSSKGPARRRAVRRIARQGRFDRAAIVSKEWFT